jgi:methyl-accepting chemotaxis protein
MSRLAQLTIAGKIYAIIALCFVAFIGVTVFQTSELGRGLESQKEIELANLAELALGAVKEEYAAAEKLGLPAAEAQKRAAARLRQMRYRDGGYFWINDMKPTIIAHPFPYMNDKDASELKDPSGKRMVVEMVERVKSKGSGYVDYVWNRKGSEKAVPKISYVKGFAPWGWMIGSGIYTDDVDRAFGRKALNLAVIMLVLTGAIVAVSLVITKSITRPLSAVKKGLQSVAEGDLTLRGEEVEMQARARGTDEMSQLLSALQHMREIGRASCRERV